MSESANFSIQEEKNVIDDHFLDIIGNEFKFSHEKGIAEWLKNSADAYRDMGSQPEEQCVVLNFTDAKGKKRAVFECIDFVGMTALNIDKALKRWGDPTAATRGKQQKMYGGHGNGGKFYMRQMFETSVFITYRDGNLNVFGFNEERRYGFAKGHRDTKMSPKDALIFAGLSTLQIPEAMRKKILTGESGFTVVRGINPHKVKRKIRVPQLLQKLTHHPQARQVLKHMFVSCIHNDVLTTGKIEPETIKPMTTFEEPFTLEIPPKIKIMEDGEEIDVEMANTKFSPGKIVLRTSAESFGSGQMADLNRIEILGELGVVASYRMNELPLKHPEFADFIYGECSCPILEDPKDDCVKNDRTKLQEDNIKTKALLKWMCEQVDALSELMHEEEAKHRKSKGDKLSSEYNRILNEWKNKMMPKLLSELLGGKGVGAGVGIGEGGQLGKGEFGEQTTAGNEGGAGGNEGAGGSGDGGDGSGHGTGEGGTGERGDEKDQKTPGSRGTGEPTDGTGGGDEKVKGRQFPLVLLSSIENDPETGMTLDLPPAQLAVYQRPQDHQRNVYWINTSRPLAESIMSKHTRQSVQWRNYLFQRYVDIFVKEALFALASKEVGFSIDQVDNEISKTIQKVHDFAAKDLEQFLFEDNFKTTEGAAA